MNNELKTLNELLVKNFKHILKIEEKVLKKNDKTKELSMTEVHTLEAIGENEEPIMSQVANKLKITIGTLSIAINRLQKKGFITKQQSKTDKRAVKLVLTQKGIDAFKEHENFHREMIDAVINELSIDEFKVVIDFLSRVSGFFAEKYNISY